MLLLLSDVFPFPFLNTPPPKSFYMCEENGRSTGFLCPNGTIFNQQYFVCDW